MTIKECQGEYDKIPITINNPYFVKYKNIFSWQNKLVQAFLTDLSFISKIKSLKKKKKFIGKKPFSAIFNKFPFPFCNE